MSETKGKSWLFRYSLTYDEAYEAFYLLAFKRSKKFKMAIGAALTLIAAVLLIGFVKDPTAVHFFFLAILSILLLFYLIYMPALHARRGAKEVKKTKGTYQIRFTEGGKVTTPTGTFSLAGDKNARALETKNLFVIRTDTAQTFCLPKRIMKEQEILEIRQLLAEHLKLIQK